MSSYKLFNRIASICILIGIIFYSPFILFGLFYGITPKVVPLFICLIALYTQILLPIIISKAIDIAYDKIQNIELKNKQKLNNDEVE